MLNFTQLGLSDDILKAITELGFENPTPIQEKMIPGILTSDDDFIALAHTGTGKTAAFGLPVVEKIDPENPNVQSVILCPTRELALQISRDLESFLKYRKGIKVLSVYGGTNISEQIRGLKRGAQIVVGTPGRTQDLIKRKALKLENTDFLVLDEADEMLTMGFKDELDFIINEMPEERQTLLFSATMPEDMAGRYLRNPQEIRVGKRNEGSSNVEHHLYVVNPRHRYTALKRIADIYPDIYGIVFCRTRRETQEVADSLIEDGYNADALHGDLSQAQRDYVMDRFRKRHLQILVATDVAARGLDVNELTHVINYNLPDDVEAYVHRSGRTGRAGREGISIAVIQPREMGKIRQIENISRRKFERKNIPGGKEICEIQLFNLVDKVKQVEVNEESISEYMPAIFEKFEGMDREEIIKHFVSAEFNRFLKYYQNAEDINAKAKSDKKERRGKFEFSRFHIKVGSRNNLNPARLMGLINENLKVRNVEIGRIEIMNKFSFFEIDKQYESLVKETMADTIFEGTPLDLEETAPRKDDGGRRGGGGYGKRSGGGFGNKRGGGGYGAKRSGGSRGHRKGGSSEGGFSRGGDRDRSFGKKKSYGSRDGAPDRFKKARRHS